VTSLPNGRLVDALNTHDELMRLLVGRPLVARLFSPAGLALAALCLLLPFITAGCATGAPQGLPAQQGQEWRVTYTGVDVLVGGQPEVAWADQTSNGQLRTLNEAELVKLIGQPPAPPGPQPLAWLAVALMAAALAVTALRATRRRAAVTAVLVLVAAVALYAATLLVREQAADAVAEVLRSAMPSGAGRSSSAPIRDWEHFPWVRDRFELRYGCWAAIGTLLLVGMANVALAVPGAGSNTGDKPDVAPD
jgi:hypothetical protein